MKWRGGRRSGNIEDRRGLSPVAGGLGVGGVVLALIGYFVFGVDPATTLRAVEGAAPAAQNQTGVRGETDDEAGQFVDVVETSTSEVWEDLFAASGQTYQRPAAVVLYDRATSTKCGQGQAAMGPFYCPADQRIYLDLTFWDELSGRFGAEGEAARAYVIAHEVAHHVQNLTGAMAQSRRLGAQGADSGAVRLELQADCYAGVWAARAAAASGGAVVLGPEDIAQGLRAASAIGDDTLQQQAGGRIVPDAFTHGTSEQRMRWFRRGAETGDPGACDTFSASRL
jgi:predicted metalloprotease